MLISCSPFKLPINLSGRELLNRQYVISRRFSDKLTKAITKQKHLICSIRLSRLAGVIIYNLNLIIACLVLPTTALSSVTLGLGIISPMGNNLRNYHLTSSKQNNL